MSFYSKISLLALLASGTTLGMTEPIAQIPQNRQSDITISITAHGAPLGNILASRLKASETLKNLLEDKIFDNPITEFELPENMVQEFNVIKDLLEPEYRLKNESINKNDIINLFKSKTEQQLVAIANACQRFELNEVGKCAIIVLAEKLNAPARKEACLKNGSLNLDWTPDVAHLVAQEMILKNYLWQLYYRFAACVGIKNCAFACEASEQNEKLPDFYASYTNRNRTLNYTLYTGYVRDGIALPNENDNIEPYSSAHDIDILRFKHKIKQDREPNIHGNQIVWKVNSHCIKMFGVDNPTELATRYSTLTPEQVTLLGYCFIKKYNKQPYELEKYPGIITISKKSLPRELAYFVPNWWQRRSWYTKAAIITGGVAAAGFAGWYGYKFLNPYIPSLKEKLIRTVSLLKEFNEKIGEWQEKNSRI